MEKEEFLSFNTGLQQQGVTLVAVSKKKSNQDILNVYDFGQRDFGENYVQELVAKQPGLPGDIRWHFIGHLQRNKVKEIAGFVHLIQGVDSERLIKEINKQAVKNNRIIQILLQVHIAEEETKFGFSREEVSALIPQLGLYPHVAVKGLMGMATLTDSEARVQKEFAGLKTFFDECRLETNAREWQILSMGMSGDYQMAIQNGSTMIRIGTLIFGKRAY